MIRHDGACKEQQWIIGWGGIGIYQHLAFERSGVALCYYSSGNQALVSGSYGALRVVDQHFIRRCVQPFYYAAHAFDDEGLGAGVFELEAVFCVAIDHYAAKIVRPVVIEEIELWA